MILNHTVPVCAVYGFDSNNEVTTNPENVIYYRFFGNNLSIIKEAGKNNEEIIFPIADSLMLVPFEKLQLTGAISYDEETDSLCFGNALRFINNFPNSDDKVLPIKLKLGRITPEQGKELIIALYSDPLIYGKPWEAKLPEWIKNYYHSFRIFGDNGDDIKSLFYDDNECIIKIDNPNTGLTISVNWVE